MDSTSQKEHERDKEKFRISMVGIKEDLTSKSKKLDKFEKFKKLQAAR